MKILRVSAHDFGKLSATLELAEGLTVVHGANEAGKSTWLQAIFAGLCGRRKGRGASLEEREFEHQYAPWNGAKWRTTVHLRRDDDQHIVIDQRDLGTKESVAHDADTGRPLDSDLVHDGCIDGSILLGLNRKVVPSTLIIGQADIQRPQQKSEKPNDAAFVLKEELQRAAASVGGAATASQAAASLAKYASEQVGTERRNSTRPLQQAIRRRDRASAQVRRVQQQHEKRQKLVARLGEARERVAQAVLLAGQLTTVQAERELERLNRRLARIDRLAACFPDGQAPPQPAEAPDAAVAEELYQARWEFRRRPDLPAPLDGPSAEELARRIAAPQPSVEGDTKVAADVAHAAEDWRAALAALDALRAGAEEEPPVPARSEGRSPSEPEAEPADSTALVRELEEMPNANGDSDVAPAVAEAAAAFRRAEDLLALAQRSTPGAAPTTAITSTADERTVRRALDLIDKQAPESPAPLRERVEQLRMKRDALLDQDRETTGRFTLPHWGAVAGSLAGILTIMGPLPEALGAAGVVLAAICSLLLYQRRAARGRATSDPAEGAQAMQDLADAKAELRGLERKHRAHERLMESIASDLEPLGLTLDQAALHHALDRLATREAWERERESWQQGLTRAQRERKLADSALRQALAERGVEHPATSASALLERYEASCKRNRDLTERRKAVETRLAVQQRIEQATAGQHRQIDAAARRVAATESALRAALARRGLENADKPTADLAHEYEAACRENQERAAGPKQIEVLKLQEEARRQLERSATRQRQVREEAEKRFRLALTAAGFPIGSTQDPAQWAEDWRQARHDRLSRRTADWQRLQVLLAGRTREELATERDQAAEDLKPQAAMHPGEASRDLQGFRNMGDSELESKLEETHQEYDAARKETLEGEAELRACATVHSLAEVREEESAAKREVALLRRAARILELAREHLGKAQEEIHRQLAPDLRDAVGKRLAKVTGGRYSKVRIDPEDGLEVSLQTANHDWHSASELSRGTCDQVYLLLRIALAEALGNRTETAPLFLDDATVHCDAERTVRFLDLLLELSEERQIVVFTQEAEVRDWAMERVIANPRHAVVALDQAGRPTRLRSA